MPHRTLPLLAACALTVVSTHAQDQTAVVRAAADALGATSLQTIEYAGWGSDFIFGQGYAPNTPWPRFHLPAYNVAIDFATPSFRDDRRRAQAENPPLGGGFQPLIGEQRQIWLMSRGYAWDLNGDAVVPAAVERDLRSPVEGRMAQVWLTPQGFIKAALAGKTSVVSTEIGGVRKQLISVVMPSGARLEGTLNPEHLVERIEMPISHPVLGDMLYEAEFFAYKRFGSISFPTRIVHRNGGYPVLDVTITAVRPNAPVSIAVPEAVLKASPPAVGALTPEKLSEGVWAMPGAARSVVVEFADHVVMIDAPESEARSLAVLEATRKLFPSKPVRYVVNTHAHFDHASGLRTYAAEGAIVVTDQQNVAFYQQAWATPRTVAPDRLARSKRVAVFEGVVGARTMTDGARRLMLYSYPGNMHNAAMLMIYLPREKMLIQADSFNPPPNPADAPAGLVNLAHFVDTVDRLRLDVEQIVPIHGRLVTMAEARTAVATFGRAQLWAQ